MSSLVGPLPTRPRARTTPTVRSPHAHSPPSCSLFAAGAPVSRTPVRLLWLARHPSASTTLVRSDAPSPRRRSARSLPPGPLLAASPDFSHGGCAVALVPPASATRDAVSPPSRTRALPVRAQDAENRALAPRTHHTRSNQSKLAPAPAAVPPHPAPALSLVAPASTPTP
ncbi:hypothetical protein B0H15DRAFT_1004133 [Mycena belliarum]|uniref:Uncharacterized protein n=1 Tax=Mycena belliarum TaxID=1033014 RepID=A0AAD6TTQ2_9AGAR|nr:hypothetical protein B0H15DRAFT_1004133 [Mycena belliae]